MRIELSDYDECTQEQIQSVEGSQIRAIEFSYDRGRVYLSINGREIDTSHVAGSGDFSIFIGEDNIEQ